MSPPPQPLLKVLSQSTSSCSERLIRDPVTILLIPSIAPVDENDQHAPAVQKVYTHKDPIKKLCRSNLTMQHKMPMIK